MNVQHFAMLEAAERRFVLAALDALSLPVEGDESTGFTLRVPSQHRSHFDGAEAVRLGFDDEATTGDDLPLESAAPGSKLFNWLVAQLKVLDTPHYAPVDQPVSVHELSRRLFDAYRVEGGTVRLGGCTLEDRPLLGLSWLDSDDDGPPSLVQQFFAPGGEPLDESLRTSLGMDDLVAQRTPPRKMPEEQILHWIAVSGGDFASDATPAERMRDPHVAACVVWCKFAAGKLEFNIGNATGEVAFAEWARRLATEEILPHPFRCPHSGDESYHIAATDDGRISIAEGIQACEATGRRVLCEELDVCEATNRRVLKELLGTCPVQQKRVLEALLQPCQMCGESVGPDALRDGLCLACREMTPVRKSDPRMARVLDEYPKLDRWRSWQIAETSTVYILVAATLLKRLLAVVEKESLELLRLARRGRFSNRWTESPAAERDEYVK